MTSKKDKSSESILSLPPGEELKAVTEKVGNTIYIWNFKIIKSYSLYGGSLLKFLREKSLE